MKEGIGVIGTQTILHDYAPLMIELGLFDDEGLTKGRKLSTSVPEFFGLSTDVSAPDPAKARERAAKRKKKQEQTKITPK
jgi:hypothetical protein